MKGGGGYLGWALMEILSIFGVPSRPIFGAVMIGALVLVSGAAYGHLALTLGWLAPPFGEQLTRLDSMPIETYQRSNTARSWHGQPGAAAVLNHPLNQPLPPVRPTTTTPRPAWFRHSSRRG